MCVMRVCVDMSVYVMCRFASMCVRVSVVTHHQKPAVSASWQATQRDAPCFGQSSC